MVGLLDPGARLSRTTIRFVVFDRRRRSRDPLRLLPTPIVSANLTIIPLDLGDQDKKPRRPRLGDRGIGRYVKVNFCMVDGVDGDNGAVPSEAKTPSDGTSNTTNPVLLESD